MADHTGSEATQVLQFVPFSSAIEIGFWHKLTKNKLEKFKLDDSLKTLHGSFVNSKYQIISTKVKEKHHNVHLLIIISSLHRPSLHLT